MIALGTLDEQLITTLDGRGRSPVLRTLPEVFAALVRDEVGDFPALRPHQRHAWHAFLVQVGALTLVRADDAALPDDATAWRTRLIGLTPGDPDGAAWALVSPPERPALLQPPVPGGDLSKFKMVETPDELDMLITATNHDLKRAVMHAAAAEHWLFALVSLQTQEGYLGSGKYGVSRMNGGFASRPGLGIEPPGGPGARFQRDAARLLALRNRVLEDYAFFPARNGLGLVWLAPWDGERGLALDQLDPFYVEICRRVRLRVGAEGRLRAFAARSRTARIDARALKGNTGDPWTPLLTDKDGRKALTVSGEGFSYKRLVPLLFPASTAGVATAAPLQEITDDDPDEGLSIVARAVARGEGKTEGYHERRVRVSRTRRWFTREVAADAPAACAHQRVADAGTFARKVLYPAALQAFTGAPLAGERTRDGETAKRRAGLVLAQFDDVVDATFFEELDRELEVLDDGAVSARVRSEWLQFLYARGSALLDAVLAAAPDSAVRHFRTRVRARDVLAGAFRRQFGSRLPTSPVDAAGTALSADSLGTHLVREDSDQ